MSGDKAADRAAIKRNRRQCQRFFGLLTQKSIKTGKRKCKTLNVSLLRWTVWAAAGFSHTFSK